MNDGHPSSPVLTPKAIADRCGIQLLDELAAGDLNGAADFLLVHDTSAGKRKKYKPAGLTTALGLGTMSTQADNNVSITGGSITGITDLAVADGGTGSSTAAGAATNLGLGTADTVTHAAQVLTKGAITDPALVWSATVTWNDAADTFTAIKLNVTDTASAAASLLADLQVGGSSKWSVGKGGKVSQSGILTIADTTESSDKDTGSIVTEGGIASEKVQFSQTGHNVANKFRIHYDSVTGEYGPQVRLTNKTGSATVKGDIVRASTGTDMAFSQAPASSDEPIGVVYEAGVSDSGEAWIWVEGAVCQVLLKDGTAATRGYWAATSDTAGRADITNADPVPATHPLEIGHSLESQSSGTNVLARILLHCQ